MRVSREPVSSLGDQDRTARPDDFARRLDYILWSRFGIRNEHLFRRSIEALLEQRFGVGRSIQARLERKCRLYEESTGVRPARVILATAWIHSARAHQLRQAGIEVIEPEEPDDPPD